MSLERLAFELRAEVSGDTLAGHAAVFDTVAKVGGHYEMLARSAFDDVLERGERDVAFLVNHDENQLLGRQSSGTLRIGTDARGLAFEVDLPDTQLGHDVKTLVRRRDLNAGSFGFIPGADQWGRASDGLQVRTHTKIALLRDASIVTFPAYSGTDMLLRSLGIPMRPPRGRSQLVRARARRLTGGRTA
jgi:HK97 family phage prohead protease